MRLSVVQPSKRMKHAWQLGKCSTNVIIFFVSDSGAFHGGVCPTLSAQPRHQGPPIHNNGSSLVDLSVKSYAVLIIEMQDDSGP